MCLSNAKELFTTYHSINGNSSKKEAVVRDHEIHYNSDLIYASCDKGLCCRGREAQVVGCWAESNLESECGRYERASRHGRHESPQQ
jgi:hypothetical protein